MVAPLCLLITTRSVVMQTGRSASPYEFIRGRRASRLVPTVSVGTRVGNLLLKKTRYGRVMVCDQGQGFAEDGGFGFG